MNRMRVAGAILGLVLLAGVAFGDTVYEALADLATAPVAIPTSPISSAESVHFTTPVRGKKTHGNPKVIVVPTFSDASATATIEVILYQRVAGTTTFATLALSQLVTASGSLTSDGTRYVAADGYVLAPTLGCQIFDVRVRTISAGNVTWTAWSLGPNTTATPRLGE